MKVAKAFSLSGIALIFVFSSLAYADIGQMIDYQAGLAEDFGAPLSPEKPAIMLPIIDDFPVNDLTGARRQEYSAIAMDGLGNFVITWTDERDGNEDVFARRYDGDGNPLGSSFKVNDDPGTADQYYPAIAMDGSGNFIITWVDERDGSRDIYAQRYEPDGTPPPGFETNFKVNDDLGTTSQSSPDIAADGSGNFVITWLDERDGNQDVYARSYDGAGDPSGSSFKVNDDLGIAGQRSPAIAMDGSGNFVITWNDDRNSDPPDITVWDIYAQRYNFPSAAQGSNFKVNDDAGVVIPFFFTPEIGMDSNGNFVIAWADKREGLTHTYAQRYKSDGNPPPGATNFRVSDADYNVKIFTWDIDVAMDGSGNFVITWSDPRDYPYDIYAQRYDSEGNRPPGFETNFKVNDDIGSLEHLEPAIAMNGPGECVITWTDERGVDPLDWYDIYAQRYNSSGTAEGQNFRVNDDPDREAQIAPDIALDGGGNFVITWADSNSRPRSTDIFAQRYDPDGNPPPGATNFLVNDLWSDWGPCKNPAIAMDASGKFVITWMGSRTWGYYWDILAQKYNSSGDPSGSEFLVNEDDPSDTHWNPAVAMDGLGNFVIAWQDKRNGNWDIFARRYDSFGNPFAVDFQVNADIGSADQVHPAISMHSDGRFVITWTDYRNGNWDIFAQRHEPDCNPPPGATNFKVNDDLGAADQDYSAIAIDGSGNFIITWADQRDGDWDIYAQRYDSDGNPPPGETNRKVSDDLGSADQDVPAIAVDVDGRFIITWQDFRNGNWDIYAQRYKSSGRLLDKNNFFVTNPAYAYFDQRTPAIVANTADIYFTWVDERRGNPDIYAKVVDWSWRADSPYEMSYTGYSPIDLVLTDPIGDSIGLSFNTIPSASYDSTQDLNGDGDKDDRILILNPLVGEYMVRVIPEPGATGYYSLTLKMGDNEETILIDSALVPGAGEEDSLIHTITPHLRGDVNRDCETGLSDVLLLIDYLFRSGEAPEPLELGDVNCDEVANIVDLVYLINYVFKYGPAPCS